MAGSSGTPSLTWLGKVVIAIFVVGCVAGAYLLANKRHVLPDAMSSSGLASVGGGGKAVEFGIAYGTEKQRWLEWAVGQYNATAEGKNVKINLIPMGSMEGAHAAVAGDKRIQVWSPASSVYKDTFVEDWQAKYGSNPIVREEPLALTPMVFVMWEERYQAFQKHYGNVDFDTVNKALHETGGWQTIGSHPDWGLFKFGHTNPGESNSGIQTLVLAGNSYFKKSSELTVSNVTDAGFQGWLGKLEAATNSDSNSTGNLMKEMVLKGPSSYDALLVYESVAIDYLKNAEGRWGAIHVIYPEYNTWNDSPYYVLNASWSSDDQQRAAGKFLDFLLSEPVQKESIVHGFRPANTNVPMRTPDSPWTRFADNGVKIDLGKICPPPKAEVVTNLLASWQRRDSR
ncbi:ABC-type glycerol-3-phosphate transport system substrate-binding protein [Granulicella aggregans]|uniref:ABC-type glycerol-3-phosphate transport system substrate-binding protein n=1 Tax=Granulicella aggregans TaxID=474949 RepID=A0A7W7Z8Q1_9BACT|nr:extracellular solute-binding protein [Granulicella aggregans]MBB5055343.1 ABC-type glycerol-3-phosphate transport system substrate-binding protein [Granulicella aggregans]